MTITPSLFESFLKCPTKCWLRFTGEPPTGNEYAEWVQTQNESYRAEAAKRLTANAPADECVIAPIAEDFRTAKWLLAVDVPVRIQLRNSRGNEAQTSSSQPSTLNPQPNDQSLLPSAATIIESRLHAIERVPSEGRGKPAQFMPVRFIFRNKLTTDDKLLLAFDAFVLSQALGREVSLGKIIHGDDHATLKVKFGARTAESARTTGTSKGLTGEVRKRMEKLAALLSSPVATRSADSHVRESQTDEETRGLGGSRSAPTPPELVLNRHCAECEFRDRCRQKAIETDDLSLLAGMSAKERQKLRSKGIFTVTQLSYTFRPRRRPKRLRDKREKYHHSLKALAIREKKIHIVGSPELKIEGTPVYLDVEGLPDRDFYYLIGLRIGHGESAVQHSLWADTLADEGKIWREFLALLETVDKPVLIHYGSYETSFSKQMAERHGSPQAESVAAKAIASALNLVSVMFAKIYFPTFSNGLKEIAGWLGFAWSETKVSGLHAILWRRAWETSNDDTSRARVIGDNAEDCRVLEIVAQAVSRSGDKQPKAAAGQQQKDVVSVESLKSLETMWPKFKSPFSELEQVNKAARWDYQRDRVYVRSSQRIRRIVERGRTIKPRLVRITRIIQTPKPACCPFCMGTAIRHLKAAQRTLQDVQFSKCGLRRICHEYHYAVLWCSKCQAGFGVPALFWPKSKYGRSLVAYLFYQIIELCIPMNVVGVSLNRLLGFRLTQQIIHNLKRSAARHYQDVQQMIVNNLAKGGMVHIDETRVSVKGKTACVWVLTNLHEVAYLYTDAREGEFVQTLLKDFRGVLISDFFTAYDSVGCPQQKCLIHLIRDLNTEVLNHPYDQELKEIVKTFAELLKAMIETVDRYGLKKHFLKKHRRYVDRFYRRLNKTVWRSEAAIKCQLRLEKNRDRLFTFLDHDSVPWNNNNAEHAIKAFARLRDVIRGACTPAAIQEYLVLLSICQTCKYMGVDFLDFLRSGEKDIPAFAASRRGRRRRTQNSQPNQLPPSTTTAEVGGA